MEHERPSCEPDKLTQTTEFLKLVCVRSEAYLKGDVWVKSKLADLKIDLWLATEHGETEKNEQVESIHQLIDIYQKVIHHTVFDPDPESINGELPIQAAAADLGQYVLHMMRTRNIPEGEILTNALEFLDEQSARSIAHECMERVSEYRGIIFEDVSEVIARAKRLISCCL